MGRLPELHRQYEPQELNQRHHEILRLHALGKKNHEICRILDITPNVVTYTINSALGKLKLGELSVGRDVSAKDIITSLQEEAVSTLAEIMRSPDSGATNRRQSAETILSRGGNPEVSKSEKKVDLTEDIDTVLSEINKIATRKRQARLDKAETITYEELPNADSE